MLVADREQGLLVGASLNFDEKFRKFVVAAQFAGSLEWARILANS
jgi:hypothetical protein